MVVGRVLPFAALFLIAAVAFLSDARAEDPVPAEPPEQVRAKLVLEEGETFAYEIEEWVKVKDTEVGNAWTLAFRVDKLRSGGAADLTVKLVSFAVKSSDIQDSEYPMSGASTVSLTAGGVPKKVGKEIVKWLGGASTKIRARNATALLSMVFPPRPSTDTGSGGRWKGKRDMRTTAVGRLAKVSILDEEYTVGTVEEGVATVSVTGPVTGQISHDRSSLKKGDKKLRGLKGSGTVWFDTATGRVASWEHEVGRSNGLVRTGTRVRSVSVPPGTF